MNTPYTLLRKIAGIKPGLLLLLAFLACTGNAIAQCLVWPNQGPSGFSGNITRHVMAVDPAGMPYVLYKDAAHDDKGTVVKYNGSSWAPVGAPGFTLTELYSEVLTSPSYYSLIIDGTGTPYVAYNSYVDTNIWVTIMKYNGSGWATVGSALPAGGTAIYPGGSSSYLINSAIATDAANVLYVLYPDSLYGGKATVKKFDGTGWVTVGTGGFSPGEAKDMHMVINSSGAIYVAFRDGADSYKLKAMMYTGSSWTDAGTGHLSSQNYPEEICLKLDRTGIPYIAFEDAGPGFLQRNLEKFNGAGWDSVMSPVFVSGGYNNFGNYSFDFDTSNNLYITGQDNIASTVYVHTLKYDGSTWTELTDTTELSGFQVYYTNMCAASTGDVYMLYHNALTDSVTVAKLTGNKISGRVSFPGVPYSGPVKVWLITYDAITHLLQAADSATVISSGTGADYEFLCAPADSFRIKAALPDVAALSTGYMPTYHTSNFYWHDAGVLYHTAGSMDAHQDIVMNYGAVAPGPGFIAGDVTTGANKGTSGAVPVAGLTMYALNAAGIPVQQARTDAMGHYIIANLPVGETYTIFPDSLNFLTTAYSGIGLTASAVSFSGADFLQHLLSGTITPATSLIIGDNSLTAGSILLFPNPAKNQLNIQWTLPGNEKAAIELTDVTGRKVYETQIETTGGKGLKQVNIGALADGVYFLTIKCTTLNYHDKIEVSR